VTLLSIFSELTYQTMIYDLINTLNILILLQSSLSIQDLSSKPTTTSSTIARLLYQPPSCPSNIAIDCGVSPCTYTPCYHPNVICRENNCGGCSAIFFDLITGQQLTDRECNTLPTIPNNNNNAAATTTEPPVAVTTKPSIPITTKAPIVTTVNGTVIVNTKNGTTSTTESEGEEGYEYEYPQQVDQYQKTRDNYGVNLNDEMIDIGRDLVNYGDLDINIAWPYTLQALSVSNPHSKIIKSSVPCTPPNKNDTNAIPCITVNTTNGTTMYYQVISTEEIGDDPVVNDYTIDNVQKTRDNMGLNLNDEVVDIGRDLINYGTLHYNMVPVSPHSSPLTASNAIDPEGINNYKVQKVDVTPQIDLKSTPSPNSPPTIGCPPDEKICPDGTVVFRELMNYCQFAPCPIPTPSAPQLVPQTQSAKQTDQNQLTPIITPCIAKGDRSDNKQCGQDMDCCGDGICDINRRCVHTPSNIGNNNINNNELFNNNELEMMENDNKSEINQMTRKIIIIIVVLLVIVLCVILPLLYWFYCKKCTLPTTKVEARREILNEIQISHNNGDNDK